MCVLFGKVPMWVHSNCNASLSQPMFIKTAEPLYGGGGGGGGFKFEKKC